MKRMAMLLSLILFITALTAGAPAAGAASDMAVLPADLRTIEAQAFMGDRSLSTVIVPDGVTSIGSRAFANSSVKKVYLPTSIASIGADAFLGCANVTCYGADDVYAQDWCAASGVPYVVMSNAAGVSVDAGSNVVQEVSSFAFDRFAYGGQSAYSDSTLQAYSAYEEDIGAVRAYVNALGANGTNFTCLGETRSTYSFGYCWTFAYTGTAATTTQIEDMYDSSRSGQVQVWFFNNDYAGTRCNLYIYIAKGLSFGDLGLRLTGDDGYMSQADVWRLAPELHSAAQIGEGEVRLIWTPQADATCYSVYEILNGTITWITTTDADRVTLTDVSYGRHSYTVRPRSGATTDCEYGAYSNTVTLDVTGSWRPAQDSSSLIVQDFRAFAGDLLHFDASSVPSVEVGQTIFSFECTENDLWILEQYANMLTSGRYNYKLRYVLPTASATQGDWVLAYTGTGETGDPIPCQHNDNYAGEVTIWYYMSSPYGTRTISAFIYISGGRVSNSSGRTFGLRFGDLGLRADGTVVDVAPEEVKTGDGSNVVQDIRFFDRGLSCGDPVAYADQTVQPFSGQAGDIGIIESYVARLTGSGSNFSLNQYYSSANGSFRSWSLEYVGTADVGEPLSQLFVTGYYGHVTIYVSFSSLGFSGQLAITSGLMFDDLGLRNSGGDVVIRRIGASSNATLRKSGNTYSTSDGRFAVSPGRAQICVDGTMYASAEISFSRSAENGQDKFMVSDYRGSDCLALTLPHGRYGTGSEFPSRQLGLLPSARYSITTPAAFFHYVWTTALGTTHNGEPLMLHYPSANDFTEGLVRVMLWDESADVAVIYIACEYASAPREVECLFAVRISTALDDDDHSQNFVLSRNAIQTLTFTDTFPDALSELYRWEVISGEGVVSLSNTISRSITVRANRPGTTVLRVTYDYSFYTTDALGVSNRYFGFAARTQDFTITVN